MGEGKTYGPKRQSSNSSRFDESQTRRFTQVALGLVAFVEHQTYEPCQVDSRDVLCAGDDVRCDVLLDIGHAEEDTQVHDEEAEQDASPLQQ